MPPAGKRNVQTTALILDAAQREFSHFGFKKVTMNEIAREVDMGKASLYYYFRTKESLFQAVITREHERFMTSVGAKLESTASARELTFRKRAKPILLQSIPKSKWKTC